MFRCGFKGFVTTAANDYVETFSFKDLLQSEHNVWVIFDQQDLGFHVSFPSGSPDLKSGASVSRFGGSVSRKVLPPPGRGSYVTSPPCARAILRASVRPSPEP